MRVGKRTKIVADVSPRFGTDEGLLNQLLIRAGVQYEPSERLTATLGFDTINNYWPARNHENRIWQQIQGHGRLGGLAIQTRSRLEARSFSDREGTSMRARFMLKVSKRIWQTRFSLVEYDELFVTLNTIPDGPSRGIDRNRVFAGLSYALSRRQAVECGYRVEYINRTDQDDEHRRQLVVQLSSSL